MLRIIAGNAPLGVLRVWADVNVRHNKVVMHHGFGYDRSRAENVARTGNFILQKYFCVNFTELNEIVKTL